MAIGDDGRVVTTPEAKAQQVTEAVAQRAYDPMSPMLLALEIAERVMEAKALRLTLVEQADEIARLREENEELRDTIGGFGREGGGTGGSDES